MATLRHSGSNQYYPDWDRAPKEHGEAPSPVCGGGSSVTAVTNTRTAAARSIRGSTNGNGLLNRDLIRSSLLREAPWAESHGADHRWFLGAAMLY